MLKPDKLASLVELNNLLPLFLGLFLISESVKVFKLVESYHQIINLPIFFIYALLLVCIFLVVFIISSLINKLLNLSARQTVLIIFLIGFFIPTFFGLITAYLMDPNIDWDYFTKVKFISIGMYPAKDVHYGTEVWTKPTYLSEIVLGNIFMLLQIQEPRLIFSLSVLIGVFLHALRIVVVFYTAKLIKDDKLFPLAVALVVALSIETFPFQRIAYLLMFVGLNRLLSWIKMKNNKDLLLMILAISISVVDHPQPATYFLTGMGGYFLYLILKRQSIWQVEGLVCGATGIAIFLTYKLWYPADALGVTSLSSYYFSIQLSQFFDLFYDFSFLMRLGLIFLAWYFFWHDPTIIKKIPKFFMSYSIGILLLALLLLLIPINFPINELIYMKTWFKRYFGHVIIVNTIFVLPILFIQKDITINFKILKAKVSRQQMLAIFVTANMVVLLFSLSGMVLFKPNKFDVVRINPQYELSRQHLQIIDNLVPDGSVVITDTFTGNVLPFWSNLFPIMIRGHIINLAGVNQSEREDDLTSIFSPHNSTGDLIKVMQKYGADYVIINFMDHASGYDSSILENKITQDYFKTLYKDDKIGIYELLNASINNDTKTTLTKLFK